MVPVGCNNGGGDGNFSQVKRLVAKWIGTRERLFSGFLPHGWNVSNAGTFVFPLFGDSQICAVFHRDHFAFCIKVPRLTTFLIAPTNCIF